MAPEESGGGVYITTQKIYDEVTGMRDDLRSAVSLLTEVREDVKDHESRIRVLEKLKYSLPLTAIAAIGAFVTDQFHLIGK